MEIYAGQLELNLHTVLGLIGLMLMFLHTLWATKVMFSKNELAITRFTALASRFGLPGSQLTPPVWLREFKAYNLSFSASEVSGELPASSTSISC